MPGKTKLRHFSSLHQKKYRQLHQQFLAEGQKIVLEIIQEAYPCEVLLGTSDWIDQHAAALQNFQGEIILCTEQEIAKISSLENPQEAIAVCRIPARVEPRLVPGDLSLYLDGLRDPGNMGTLIRLADWFGIRQIFASGDTVDWTNPKVIQSTMGSFIRVDVTEALPDDLFMTLDPQTLVMAADLQGVSIYNPGPALQGILIIGNESHGISAQLDKYITQRLHVPRFPAESGTAESLNAAVATSLIIGELRRRQLNS